MFFWWAGKNNMLWKNTKFQVLRIGKNVKLKENSFYFSPNFSNPVEECEVVHDMGIHIYNQLTYNSHRNVTLKKVWKKMGWIKRTFRTRSVAFLKIAWNSLLQPQLDNGLVLVCPFLKGEKGI